MRAHFELACGSVIGRDHRDAGTNNQDALSWSSGDDATVAAVCDGCGSGAHSELGARLGARLVAEAVRHHVGRLEREGAEAVLASARRDVLSHLGPLVEAVGGDRVQAIAEHFLFTILGVVVAREETFVFAIGDGIFAVNGAIEEISYPENSPPYLGYELARGSGGEVSGVDFKILARLPTSDVRSLLIATDGAAGLLHAADRDLLALWREDRLFTNPFALGRRLSIANRDATRLDWERRRVERARGLLRDDTTVVVIRRRGCEVPACAST